MPISVKGPDGSTVQFPDGTKPEVMQSAMQAKFGGPSTAAKPSAAPAPAAPNPALQKKAREIYETARQSIASRITDVNMQNKELARFDTDPRMRRIREVAGYTPVETRRQAIKDTARQVVNSQLTEGASIRNLGGAAIGGINNAFLGAPAWLASKITGVPNDVMQGVADEFSDRAPVASGGINILGSLASGGAVAKLAGKAGARLAASNAPRIVKGFGNVLESIATLRKGQTARNVARVSGAGAAGGAVEAGIKDRNVLEGAATGAVVAPLVHGGIKLAVAGAKGVRALAGSEPVQDIISKYIKTPMADIQAAMDARAKAGLPSTMYEVLPFRDREALDDAIGKMPAAQREKVANMVRGRAGEIAQETQDAVGRIARPTGPDRIRPQIASDLAHSRGDGNPATAEDMAMAERASRDPTEMAAVQATEARNVMAPHDARRAYDNLSDILPQEPRLTKDGGVEMVEFDPEASSMIRAAAGRLALRPPEGGITVRDVTNILSRLSKFSASGDPIQANSARNAAEHVMDALERDHPDISQATAQMRRAWRSRQVMIDGMLEGSKSRTRTGAGFAGADPNDVRTAYDTPEGAAGRNLGQSARLQTDLGQTPEQALTAANQIGSNPSRQAAITENLGNDAGQNIADVAQLQSQSAQRLAGLDKERGSEGGLDPAKLLQNLTMLAPGTFMGTKASAIARLTRGALRIPERQAEKITDMLFSSNPAQISQGMKFLMKSGQEGRSVLQDLGGAITVGRVAADVLTAQGEQLPTDTATEPLPDDPGTEQMPENQTQQVEGDSPYNAALQQIYDTESPDLLDLVERVQQQESGGDPGAVSSAGAVGLMQVMPGTGPEAAKLAGVPWDENAYHTDPAYQKVIGIAYLSHLLERYDGDVEHALAAYNAGAGRVDEALSSGGDDWLSMLPAETQDYVQKIG